MQRERCQERTGERLAKCNVTRLVLFSLLVLTSHLSPLTSHQVVEAGVSSGDSHEIQVSEFGQAGPGGSSPNFNQQATVAGPLTTPTIATSQFEIVPGFWGALFVGQTTPAPIDELDLTVLYAKTDPLGVEIPPATWQTDHDPIFIWAPPVEGLELAGYSYAIDSTPDEMIDTIGTSFDVATQLSEPLSDGTHTFAVKAINTAGVGGDPIIFELWVDTTPPDITGYGPASGTLLNTLTPSVSVSIFDKHSGLSETTVELLINGASVPVLFDPATQTISTSGVVAFQEGSNSLKVAISDAAGNAQAPLLWGVMVDTIPPTGTLRINSGAEMTTSLYVTLGLSAADATSGVIAMQLSNEAFTGYVQEPFAAIRELWPLNAIQGIQRVYVKFLDAAGNESKPIFDEIDLSLLSPETIITGGPVGFTGQLTATFTFMCSKEDCVFSFAFDNDEWSPWSTDTEAPIADLSAGNHYFRVKAAREINGIEEIQPEEEDPSPAERTWIVTIGPPPLMIPFGPPIKLWRIE